MKLYFFKDPTVKCTIKCPDDRLEHVLREVADTSNTDDLVTALYLLNDAQKWKGEYLMNWKSPQEFDTPSRGWAFVREFDPPSDLPERFKIIRLCLNPCLPYPRKDSDCYGWNEEFEDFESHVAFLFAHELHHFRRYYLDLHPREGEHSANAWALQRVQKLGYQVQGTRPKPPKRRTRRRKQIRSVTRDNPDLLKKVKNTASHLSFDDLDRLKLWIWNRRKKLSAQKLEREWNEHFEHGLLANIIALHRSQRLPAFTIFLK